MKPADVELRESRPIGAGEPAFDGYPGALCAHVQITVVVPTRQRPKLLERCLGALCAQDLEPTDYEIVVCDDGPDDATRASVERTAALHARRGLAIRYVAVRETQGPAAARNAGWRVAPAPTTPWSCIPCVPRAGA